MPEATTSPRPQPVLRGDHPPKPVLTLRVGISGHRPKPERMPAASFDLVKQRLRAVFDGVDAALVAAKAKNADFYAHEPGKPPHRVRLVSGLAEGADQFAIAARPPAWQVDAILPFPEASYLRDFETSAIDGRTDVTAAFKAALAQATSVTQLPEDPRIARGELTPERDSKRYWLVRDQGYTNLGKFLLGQTDLLVVVWDGLPEEGPGGTATVVRDAIDAGIQVVWIAPQRDIEPAMIASVDDEHRPTRTEGDFDALLREAVSTLVSVPPDSHIGGAHGHGRGVRERLETFRDATWPRRTLAVTYDLFRRICHLQWSRVRFRILPEDIQNAYLKPWTDFVSEAPAAGALDERIKAILLPRYMWADALAVERSHWYRAAYFNSYLLAAVTVGVALLGAFAYDIFSAPEPMLIYKAGLITVELILLSLIYWIVTRGARRHWQENWVEYRALAEMLRSTRALAYLGVYGNIQRAGRLEPPDSAWFLWYLRATIRELGIPNAVLDETYLRDQLATVRKHVIKDQLDYHVPTVGTMHHLHHVLQETRDISFFITVGVIGLFLVAYVIFFIGSHHHGATTAEIIGWTKGHVVPHTLGEAHDGFQVLGWVLYRTKSYVTFIAAFLPALVAALAGIQETGDFEGLALRSAKTASALGEIDAQIVKIMTQPTLDSTAAALLSTAEVLTEDLGAWQSIYGRKHLGLP